MPYEHKGFTIDATPSFSIGRFFARAWVTRGPSNGEGGVESYDSGDLGQFDIEKDAIAFAQAWAVSWIDEHEHQLTARDA